MTESRIPASIALALLLLALPVMGQDSETADDTVAVKTISWTERLVVPISQSDKRNLLFHPWDVWSHADMFTTVANPFVQSDVMVGAAMLDGSYGMPLLPLAIPIATQRRHDASTDEPSVGPGDALIFRAMPMNETERTSQTLAYWDQGDAGFRDVQVGAAVILDGNRSLVVAAQGSSHPGPFALSGTADKFSMQNYMVDYRTRLAPNLLLGYTILHQQEVAGQPYVGAEFSRASDFRHSETWSQGLTANFSGQRVELSLYASGMSGQSRITDLADTTTFLNRTVATGWIGGEAQYQVRESITISASWHDKSRRIKDRALGYSRALANNNGIMVNWLSGPLTAGAGLSFGDGSATPEIAATLETKLGTFGLSYGTIGFLSYPHANRRATLDSTVWVTTALPLVQAQVSYALNTDRLQVSGRAARLIGDFEGTALTGAAQLTYHLWPNLARLSLSGSALQTDAAATHPVRMNGHGELTITAPIGKSRARPFATIAADYVAHDFTAWFDPRYGDLALLNPLTADPTARLAWATYDIGIKVRGFEVRRGMINFTDQSVQNSPDYLSSRPMKHLSMTWQFFPSTD